MHTKHKTHCSWDHIESILLTSIHNPLQLFARMGCTESIPLLYMIYWAILSLSDQHHVCYLSLIVLIVLSVNGF